MAEPPNNESMESSPGSAETNDKDFDPCVEMMIHEFDDERTMDEEEEYLSGESCGNELDDLQKEGEMPLEQLLAMYGYGGDGAGAAESRSSSEEEIITNNDLALDKEVIGRELLKNVENEAETSVTNLLESVETPSRTCQLLAPSSTRHSSDGESEDSDYQPVTDEYWKKYIQVGTEYQAEVPEGLTKYGDIPAYENEDRLLWNPDKLPESEVENYLREAQRAIKYPVPSQLMTPAPPSNTTTLLTSSTDGIQPCDVPSSTSCSSLPGAGPGVGEGPVVQDDEQALYLLQQCGHHVEEALRRRRMQAVPTTDAMSLWSEDECRNFEHGLRTYGKDFHLIQQTRVRTRSVGELVHFYYLWKKTERHDMFANKYKVEKKRFINQPGITDYMERFLDDQENLLPASTRSASPSIHSLIYGDHKRQHQNIRQRNTTNSSTRTDWPTSPSRDVTRLRRDLTSPRRDLTSSRRDLPNPRRDVTSPRRDVTSPRCEVTSPRREVMNPRRDVTSPKPSDHLNTTSSRDSTRMHLRSPTRSITCLSPTSSTREGRSRLASPDSSKDYITHRSECGTGTEPPAKRTKYTSGSSSSADLLSSPIVESTNHCIATASDYKLSTRVRTVHSTVSQSVDSSCLVTESSSSLNLQ